MSSKLCALKFIQKYQLIPRAFRLDMLQNIEYKEEQNELISTLIGYEKSHNDDEFDYDDLWLMLEEYVYAGETHIYYDIATYFLQCLQSKKITI